jgi:hypothetical protein
VAVVGVGGVVAGGAGVDAVGVGGVDAVGVGGDRTPRRCRADRQQSRTMNWPQIGANLLSFIPHLASPALWGQGLGNGQTSVPQAHHLISAVIG